MKRILIVEDEVIVARDIRQQLIELNHEPVASTATGEEALLLTERLRPDLVLMDIQLAGAMDGIMAARCIRERFDIPVVFLTAFVGDESVRRATLAEPFGYITKPLEERDLRITIAMALQQHQGQQVVRSVNQQLLANEERFKQLASQSRTSIWVVNPEGRYTYCSPVFSELTGYPVEELVDRKRFYDLHPEKGREDFQRAGLEALAGKAPFRDWERPIQTKDGRIMWVSSTGIPDLDHDGNFLGYRGWSIDITERKWGEAIMAARVRLLQLAFSHSLAELLRATLDEAETLTGSRVGFYHVVEPDQATLSLQAWSTNTTQGLCRAEGAGRHYPVSQAGVWVDCIRQRRPVIHNDYAALPHRQGLPEGHVPILRELVVPVRRGEAIVAVLGVGNKPADYDERDVKTVASLADLAWDITENKRTAEALQASERRFREIADHAREWIWEVDAEGKYTYASPVAETILGYTIEEVRQKHFYDCFHPDDRESRKAAALAAFALKQPFRDFINRNVHKNGQTVWLATSGLPQLDERGNLLGYRGVDTDITERKQAEASLRQQAALLEITRDAIVVQDLDGRLRFMNPAAEAMTGWCFAEASTREPGEVLVFKEEAVRQAAHQETLRQGAWMGEIGLLNRQKKELELESRWTLVRDEAGRPQSILMVSTDITRVKALKAQYLRAQRLESIGTLASGIAHDLNNVLSPILMGLEVIKTEVKSQDNLTLIAMVESSARRGADTVKQLLTFARGTVAQKGLFQPRHLFQEIAQLLQRTFPKNIQIYPDYPDRPWAMLGDPSQIHQVLMNLSVNARDAMPAGGVLFLKLRSQVLGEAGVSLHPRAQPGPYVVFEVTDSGQGMPPEVVERIFEPFFTTKPLGQGTGLGLSTVIGIVEEHGGFVLVDTQVGRGTTFSAFLPAAPDAHETPAEPSRPEGPPRHEEGILVVDDEPSILMVAHRFLTQQGYKVRMAKSASEALELFQAHRSEIQLVITDIMMPFGDGWQLIQRVRELDPHLPILVMSGVLTPSLRLQMEAIEACGFLAKPFAAEGLLAKLRELLPVNAISPGSAKGCVSPTMSK